jgi:hypothetical protein
MSQAGIIRSTGSSPPPTITIVGNDQTNKDGFGTNVTGTSPNFVVNSYGLAKWVVNPVAGLGTHTTISSAIASASSGDDIFITEGTYTENPTLKAGVNLIAFTADAYTPNVIISGTVTASYAGAASISGIQLVTNGAAALNFTGANATSLSTINCSFNALNSNAITSTAASAALLMYNCISTVTGTNQVFAITSIGGIGVMNSPLAGGTAANTIASGAINIYSSNLASMSFTTSSVGSINSFDTLFNGGTLTLSGTNASMIENCSFASGANPCIVVGAGCSVSIAGSQVTSSNADVITGAGSAAFAGLTFTGDSDTINTTTQTLLIAQPGAQKVVIPPSYPYNMASQDTVVFASSATAANTINLPAAPSDGEIHTIKDITANAGTNNITISGNGNNIVSTVSASSYVMSSNGESIDLIFSVTADAWGIK